MRKIGRDNADTHGSPTSAACARSAWSAISSADMFLSLAYFDLPYNVLVLVVAAKRWLGEARSADGTAGAATQVTSGGESTRAPTPAHTAS